MAYKPKMTPKYSQLLQSFQEQLQRGDQLSPAAYKNYKRLLNIQNKDQFQADQAAQKQQAADYQQAQDTAGQRAIGNYLSPTSNYNWNQYTQEAGIDPSKTQGDFLRGLSPQDYGQATGRADWNMGQALSGPNNQDFQNQFGYDIKNALNPATSAYTPESFKKDFGQDLKDLSTQTGISDFQRYLGNTGWSLADQLKQFTGKDLENSPGYQFGLKQGQQALDRTAAARGGALGGGQLKAQTQYANDYAGTKFNDAFNQDMATKQMNLGQFNNYVNSDMGRKANLLNVYQGQQTNQLNLNNQELAKSGNALNQYNNWWQNTNNNQNRDLANFYQLAGYKNTIGNNVLNNYQQNWNNYENQRNTYGNYLMNLAQMGQNAAGNTAGMMAGQNNAMADRFTGAASANAQNNWNNAMATNQAVQGGMNNIAGLAGMYGGANGGKNWFSTKPLQSYGDINGPGMSTVVV